MPAYLLNVPPDLWAAFRRRCQEEGVTMRSVLLAAVRQHVDREEASATITVQVSRAALREALLPEPKKRNR